MLLDLLRTPSSFPGQPVAWARNQAGHAGVGMLLVWFLGPWSFAVLGVAYALWEGIQWRRYGGEDWDCVQDWAFVMTGALVPAMPLLLVPLAAFLGAGYLRRLDGA